MQLELIEHAISNWNAIRTTNPNIILSYLKQGFCFEVYQADYQTWSTMYPDPDNPGQYLQPEFINAYLGITDNTLGFFLIDSISDKNGEFDNGNNILARPFLKGVNIVLSELPGAPNHDNSGESMNILGALTRIYQWQSYANHWAARVFNEEQEEEEIFQIMQIPFVDYKTILDSTEHNTAINMFALRHDQDEDKYVPEMIVSAIDILPGIHLPTDHSIPVPPFKPGFSKDKFKLLIESIG